MKRKYYQGFFTPKNIEKYIGNVKEIVYRSLLEYKYMCFFDTNVSILQWGSEEIIIPYFCDVDKAVHRYFPDFFIKYKTKDKEIKKAIIEIKPENQCIKPKSMKGKKTQKRIFNYKKECLTYIQNLNKWEAARVFCKKHDMEFKIFTEKTIQTIIKI